MHACSSQKLSYTNARRQPELCASTCWRPRSHCSPSVSAPHVAPGRAALFAPRASRVVEDADPPAHGRQEGLAVFQAVGVAEEAQPLVLSPHRIAEPLAVRVGVERDEAVRRPGEIPQWRRRRGEIPVDERARPPGRLVDGVVGREVVVADDLAVAWRPDHELPRRVRRRHE
jgi:hypothetical protein